MKFSSKKFLDKLEKACSFIPHPIVFFLWLILITIIAAFILNAFSASFIIPSFKDGAQIDKVYNIKNVLTVEGLRFMLNKSLVSISSSNIIPVLIVAMIGLGIAEGSGYLKSLFIGIIGKFKSSGKIATILLLLLGVTSNIAIDAGYLVLIPLGGIVFLMTNRNPMLGIVVAFVGVSGGFAANFFLGGTDVILAGITTNAAQVSIPNYIVPIESNYYFAIASSVIIIIAGFIITEFFMVKKYKDNQENKDFEMEKLTKEQSRALKIANIVSLTLVCLILIGSIPENGILRNPETRELWKNSPLSNGIIAIFSLWFGISGFVYGKFAKTIKKADDVIQMMAGVISLSAVSIVSFIFAYQFLNVLEFSGIGMGLASLLISAVKSVDISGFGFLGIMIFGIAFLNLFIGSASVKWATISYILVPVFISFGYTPELALAAFRIGDSSTNIISPAMVYLPIVLGQMQKYNKNANMGTLISMTLPYSVILLIVWTLLLFIFFAFNIPLGPNSYATF